MYMDAVTRVHVLFDWSDAASEVAKELSALSPYALILGIVIAGIIVLNCFFLRQFRKLHERTLEEVNKAHETTLKELRRTIKALETARKGKVS